MGNIVPKRSAKGVLLQYSEVLSSPFSAFLGSYFMGNELDPMFIVSTALAGYAAPVATTFVVPESYQKSQFGIAAAAAGVAAGYTSFIVTGQALKSAGVGGIFAFWSYAMVNSDYGVWLVNKIFHLNPFT